MVKGSFFKCPGAPDTVDICEPMKCHKRLRFPRIKCTMFPVHPNAVEAHCGGMTGIIGKIASEIADACNFSGSDFGEHFRFSHGLKASLVCTQSGRPCL